LIDSFVILLGKYKGIKISTPPLSYKIQLLRGLGGNLKNRARVVLHRLFRAPKHNQRPLFLAQASSETAVSVYTLCARESRTCHLSCSRTASAEYLIVSFAHCKGLSYRADQHECSTRGAGRKLSLTIVHYYSGAQPLQFARCWDARLLQP